MRKIWKAVVMTGSLLGFASISHATIMTLEDTTTFNSTGTEAPEDYLEHGWGDVNKLDDIFDYVSWTHHYDFSPPAGSLVSANLTLYLRDDSSSIEDGLELALGYAEDGSWDLGEVNTGQYSYNLDLASLGNGELGVSLYSAGGDFYIDSSVLEINYIPVPEPGTLFLLSSGLAGLAMARRTKK